MSCPLCSISKAADEKHLRLSHPTSAPVRVHFSPGFRWGWVGVLGLPPRASLPGRLRTTETRPLPGGKAKGLGVGRGRTLWEGRRGR